MGGLSASWGNMARLAALALLAWTEISLRRSGVNDLARSLARCTADRFFAMCGIIPQKLAQEKA